MVSLCENKKQVHLDRRRGSELAGQFGIMHVVRILNFQLDQVCHTRVWELILNFESVRGMSEAK